MKENKLQLINENTSPLFRIMSVYNSSAPNKGFANNICAFHIGKGIIISVAHNLRAFDRLPLILTESFYQNELRTKISNSDKPQFDRIYQIMPGTNHRIATGINQTNFEPHAKFI